MSEATPRNPTPMLLQYQQIKKAHPDALLFYRMGDFYEMFFDDAVTAAPVLEVQLTSRDRNAENPIPMCGVPHHAAATYVQKLVAKGFRVAICEQMEDPRQTKGLVKREVIRVVTPALIGDPELMQEEARNLLVALHAGEASGDEVQVETAILDLMRGEVRLGTLSSRALLDLFSELEPRELLIPEDLDSRKWLRDSLKLFPSCLVTRRGEYFIKAAKGDEAVAVSALKAYLRETQKLEKLPHLQNPIPLQEAETLSLDVTTLASLEVVKGLNAREGTTLFEVVDQTCTPMGRRLLRDWLTRPLSNRERIEERHGAVENLLESAPLASQIKETLSQVRDLERLTSKAALGLAMPRDLVAIREVMRRIPDLQKRLQCAKAKWLKRAAKRLAPLPELTELMVRALEDMAPATLREGGIFRDDYNPEIKEYRGLSRDAKGTIASIEARERERTGITTLKIKYSRVFGYTIEVTKSQLGKVPKEYHRKQTIAGGERYVTEELKGFEEKVISAEYRLKTLEEGLFLELRNEVATHSPALLANARVIAELDVLLGFATVARTRGYVRPVLHDGWDLFVDEGRHPVVEARLGTGEFVPNSVHFEEGGCRTLLITGPNMAGKSTIMRQVALISLLAQAGSFVPARAARLPLLDAIYTRIGSSDDLSRGRSTFMVEMTEVARILESATPKSLILIDEIGRGTSTYDGLSLAWSLLEHIHKQVQAKTLFATHFHEVTSLEKSLPGLRNVNVLVEKWKNEIVFLHRLGPGACSQSYGIEVAKLAGLPSRVLLRAKEILGHLESQSQRGSRARHRALEIHDNQLVFFDEIGSLENLAEPDSDGNVKVLVDKKSPEKYE